MKEYRGIRIIVNPITPTDPVPMNAPLRTCWARISGVIVRGSEQDVKDKIDQMLQNGPEAEHYDRPRRDDHYSS